MTANVENECGSRIKIYEKCRRYDDVVVAAVAGYKTQNEINTRNTVCSVKLLFRLKFRACIF